MRVCIDAGHGNGNATPGEYDPGAVVPLGTGKVEEAAVALDYAITLEATLQAAGHEVMLTRRDCTQSLPVHVRARMANTWKADVLISLHCNAFSDPAANGVEIEWRDQEDKQLADILLKYLLRATGLKDHGNDQRVNLAVLKFEGPAVLIELGFLTNEGDRKVILNPTRRGMICDGIRDGLEEWRPRPASQKDADRINVDHLLEALDNMPTTHTYRNRPLFKDAATTIRRLQSELTKYTAT